MKKNMKILLFLLVVGLLLAVPISNFFQLFDVPPTQEQIGKLDKLADEMLEAAKKGDMDTARVRLNRLAEMFPNQTLPVTIRIESLNAITQSILAAKQTFSSAKAGEDLYIWHATRVRVAIDALSHEHQPMWKNYYPSYSDQMQHLLQASVERNAGMFRAQLEENYRLFLAIRPAMSIHLKEQQMNLITTSYEQLTKELKKENPDWQMVRETLRDLHSTMQESFSGNETSAWGVLVEPGSPFMMIMTVSLAVTLTLAYVAWKKYSGEQGKLV
ncbi:sporulation protein YpjB [Brevibacillus ginsengisoli]|uniref:sporulation protein YpjB n=1 Tax=Brevibacillus ginsengisoli TaxID=363854 RepID=UPI003CF5E784